MGFIDLDKAYDKVKSFVACVENERVSLVAEKEELKAPNKMPSGESVHSERITEKV